MRRWHYPGSLWSALLILLVANACQVAGSRHSVWSNYDYLNPLPAYSPAAGGARDNDFEYVPPKRYYRPCTDEEVSSGRC